MGKGERFFATRGKIAENGGEKSAAKDKNAGAIAAGKFYPIGECEYAADEKFYPGKIIGEYAAGKISRRQFIARFSDWQKSRGINYDCKGTADKGGVYLTYRGTRGKIDGEKIRFYNEEAKSAFDFRRAVDFLLCKRLRGLQWT